MDEVNNEEITEEVIQETPPTEEVAEEQIPEVDLSKFESKDDPDVIKLDLSKPIVDENQTDLEESIEEVAQEEDTDNETPTLEEITDEEVVTEEEVEEAIEQSEQLGKPLPDNVQKLMDFMDETGGDLADYVNLNRDVKDLDDQDAMLEYYKRTKPHLNSEEISFLMEDNFSFDEELDDERDVRRKKLALKEQVAEAKTYLDGQKSKYYEDIKAGSKLTSEQQKAIDFFSRYNEEAEQTQKVAQQQKSRFNKKTEQVFNDNFKGFEYSVGDKNFRFNVKDANKVKENQSDINNFVKKFLNEDNTMNDAKGYHKSLYTAMNADAVASHFYEQGKADALKDSVAKAKNINTTARSSHGDSQTGGTKFKVLGDDSASFKFKIKNKN
tara:strand:+ start:2865 stop:4013 length:1149 start_codon:yes stop_codon:yes gene_type:complete